MAKNIALINFSDVRNLILKQRPLIPDFPLIFPKLKLIKKGPKIYIPSGLLYTCMYVVNFPRSEFLCYYYYLPGWNCNMIEMYVISIAIVYQLHDEICLEKYNVENFLLSHCSNRFICMYKWEWFAVFVNATWQISVH